MKKYLLFVVFLVAAAMCFAQGFDDMPYSNPDFMTYFQQEMTSLLRFQTDNSINVPFFASFSGRAANLEYKSDYVNNLYSESAHIETLWEYYTANGNKVDADFELLTGVQFRPHRTVYIPLFFSFGFASVGRFLDDEWVYPPASGLVNGFTGNERVPVEIDNKTWAMSIFTEAASLSTPTW